MVAMRTYEAGFRMGEKGKIPPLPSCPMTTFQQGWYAGYSRFVQQVEAAARIAKAMQITSLIEAARPELV